MMKIIIFISLQLLIFNIAYSQVKINNSGATSSIVNHSAFLDASSSILWNGSTNNGKGLLFPRTDLTLMTVLLPNSNPLANNNPNRFDGMVVYNTTTGTAAIGGTSVIPGFYYYRNTSTTSNSGGTWVSMVPIPATADNSMNTVTFNATNGTIGTSNGTVYCTGALTLTLPVANTATGKIYRIIKNDSDNSVLTFSENIYLTTGVNFNTLNYAKSFTIQSNGTNWTVVN